MGHILPCCPSETANHWSPLSVHTLCQWSWFCRNTRNYEENTDASHIATIRPSISIKVDTQDYCHQFSSRPNVKYCHNLPFCSWVMVSNNGQNITRNIMMSQLIWNIFMAWFDPVGGVGVKCQFSWLVWKCHMLRPRWPWPLIPSQKFRSRYD